MQCKLSQKLMCISRSLSSCEAHGWSALLAIASAVICSILANAAWPTALQGQNSRKRTSKQKAGRIVQQAIHADLLVGVATPRPKHWQLLKMFGMETLPIAS